MFKMQYSIGILKELRTFYVNQGASHTIWAILRTKSWPCYIIKACVHYFLSNLYLSLNDSPSKTMKNVFYFI